MGFPRKSFVKHVEEYSIYNSWHLLLTLSGLASPLVDHGLLAQNFPRPCSDKLTVLCIEIISRSSHRHRKRRRRRRRREIGDGIENAGIDESRIHNSRIDYREIDTSGIDHSKIGDQEIGEEGDSWFRKRPRIGDEFGTESGIDSSIDDEKREEVKSWKKVFSDDDLSDDNQGIDSELTNRHGRFEEELLKGESGREMTEDEYQRYLARIYDRRN